MDNKTIVGYPLNGVQYSAEDAQTYLCTRTSGIYSSEDNFRFGGVVNYRYVVIQPGLAWMKVSQFGGISFALREAVQVYVEGGGDTDRTDLIVLRYDGNQNECSVVCKRDSTSVDRDNNIFELGLYKVFVEAGSTQIIGLGSDVQDVRLSELCGIMKDGVTGIPVENLVEEFRANVQASIDIFNSNAANAIAEFNADGDAAIAEINQEAESELSTIHESANFLLGTFVNNANTAISDANASFTEVKNSGNAIVQELNETEASFNQSVENANAAIKTFEEVTAPNALAKIDSDAQLLFADIEASGETYFSEFESKGDQAIDAIQEAADNIAGGVDTMLQSVFNPSGRIEQVAFESQIPLSVMCGYVKNSNFGISNFAIHPFTDTNAKKQLLRAILNCRPINLRFFSVRQESGSVSQEEWLAAINFVNQGTGNFEEVFDPSLPVFDLTFNRAEAAKTDSSKKAIFIGYVEDGWKSLKITLGGTNDEMQLNPI